MTMDRMRHIWIAATLLIGCLYCLIAGFFPGSPPADDLAAIRDCPVSLTTSPVGMRGPVPSRDIFGPETPPWLPGALGVALSPHAIYEDAPHP